MKKIFTVLFILLFVFATSLAHATDLNVKSGSMNFLMGAPLEDIKGKTDAFSGKVTVDEKDLKSIKGEVDIDITKIVIYTFDDAEKNKTQNEHMLNWFEVGSDVDAATKDKFKTARLQINGAKSVEKKSDESLLQLDGSLTLHGITKIIPMELTVIQQNGIYQVKTAKPFSVGLVEHDIKPRDIAGKILQKTLEALGEKVAKYAQVSVDVQFE